MTAINVIRQSRAVHIITDGSAYSAGGVTLDYAVKAWPVPHLNAVIAFRGPAVAAALLSMGLAGASRSYDHLKENISRIASEQLSAHPEALAQCHYGSDLDIVVGGISESTGPDAYIVSNHRRYGFEPWQLLTVDTVSLMPSSDLIQRRFVEAFPPGVTPDDLEPIRDGARILEMQRDCEDTLQTRDGPTKVRLVGGFGQLSAVTKNSITTRIICRW